MISRQTGLLGHFLRCGLLASALVLPGIAGAGEIQPFDIPPEPTDSSGSPALNTGLPDFVEPAPGASSTGAAADNAVAPVAVDTRPPMVPPPIDAYVDVSFNDSNINDFGYHKTPGGYRFIAGFIFEQLSSKRFTVASEVGYVRIGLADETTTTVTRNNPIPNYDNVKTYMTSLDLSTLTFGLRGSVPLAERLDGFARAGLHFYHGSRHDQTTYSYIRIPPNTTELPDDVRPTFSTTDVGTDYYVSGGIAYRIGVVPTIYAEYGVFAIGSNNIATTSIGFLLNF